MDANDYQTLSARSESDPEVTARTLSGTNYHITVTDTTAARLIHAQLGMSSEVGEFTNTLKKWICYGKPLDSANLAEEIGDICWYLALAATTLGVPLSDILEANIRKLRARYPDAFDPQRAEVRDLEAERRAMEGKS